MIEQPDFMFADVVVQVLGGTVSSIKAPENLSVVVVDWDDLNAAGLQCPQWQEGETHSIDLHTATPNQVLFRCTCGRIFSWVQDETGNFLARPSDPPTEGEGGGEGWHIINPDFCSNTCPWLPDSACSAYCANVRLL